MSSLRNLGSSTLINVGGAKNGKDASSEKKNIYFLKSSY